MSIEILDWVDGRYGAAGLLLLLAFVFRKQLIAALQPQEKTILVASLEALIGHTKTQSDHFAANNEMFRDMGVILVSIESEIKSMNKAIHDLHVEIVRMTK